MSKLVDIINEHGLYGENHEQGTDKHYVHDYINNFYQQYFEPIQYKNIKLLEIGTCTGASLKMWKEFFVNGIIEGVDVEDKRLDKYKDENIKYYFADAYDIEFVNTLSNYDIIIDDGPHTLESQLLFIKLYSSKINKNGFMIIEDIDSSNSIQLICDEINNQYNAYPKIIDKRKEVGLSNEILIWIKK